MIENQSDLVAGIEAFRKANTVFQAELEAIGIIALVLFSAIIEIAEWSLATKHLAPGNLIDKLANLCRGLTDGIHATDQPAHAGAGNVADRDVMFFEPGDHADVGESQRRSTFENKTYFGMIPEDGVAVCVRFLGDTEDAN